MARVRQTARKRAVGAGKSRAKAAAVNAGAEAESETESESESWLDKVDGFLQYGYHARLFARVLQRASRASLRSTGNKAAARRLPLRARFSFYRLGRHRDSTSLLCAF